jgi:hypothetical protein
MNVLIKSRVYAALLCCLMLTGSVLAESKTLPDPDGKEADMSKPVQVYILMGQSNMLGFGNAGALKGTAAEKYPYLVDDGGAWNVRKDVRNVFFCMGKLRYNDWLTAGNGNGSGKFGPEIGIGNHLGHAIDAPVMILKVCVGNRALGWDLLPPSAKGTGTQGKSYEGNSESSNREVDEEVKAKNGGWYAGLQYDQDVGAAQRVLKNLSTYYPGASKYEVRGFFWWQGNAEGKGSVENYDKNLAFLFKDLRTDFNAPNAKFVCATLGEHDKSATLSKKMYSFAGLSEFKDQAAIFYSKPFANGGSGGHYGGDPNTYMGVGEGMGKLMVELLGKEAPSQNTSKKSTSSGAAAVQLSTDQRTKLTDLIKATLVDMSDQGELKPVALKISKTRAKIWLAKADSAGALSFQIMNGTKQASFNFEELQPADHIMLSRLIAALRPKDAAAQAIAGLYIDSSGNKRLATSYFKKTNQEAVQEIVSSLQE